MPRRIEEDQSMSGFNNDKDLLDIILDPDNTDPISLYNGDGAMYTFEQVAVIPFESGEEKLLFVILKPLDELDWVEDDEALVFRVVESEEGKASLHMEEDEDLAMQVFQEYYRLLDEAIGGEE